MASVFRIIADSAPAAAEALINSVWQGLLVVLIVWLVLRATARINATTRYGIWWGAMLAVVALPLVNAGVLEYGQWSRMEADPIIAHVAEVSKAEASAQAVRVLQTIRPDPSTTSVMGERRNEKRAVGRSERRVESTVQHRPITSEEPASPSSSEVVALTSDRPQSNNDPSAIDRFEAMLGSLGEHFPIQAPSGRVPLVFFGAIALGMAAGAVRLCLGCLRMRRIKQTALLLPPRFQEMLSCQAATLGLRRRVAFAASDLARVPTAIGFRHPVVLIPSALLDELTETELEQVTLHELAHLRRWDDWTNLGQRIIEALFFFHPAVRWAGRQICLEREIACDDWVVTQTGRVRPYAVCLTRLVALSRWSGRTAPALGIVRTKSQFTRRIEALLDRRRNARPGMSRVALATSGVILLAVLLQVGRLPLVFAVSEPEQPGHKLLLALTPSSPRAAVMPVRVRMAPAYAAGQAVHVSAASTIAPVAGALEAATAAVAAAAVSPLPPSATDWTSAFGFEYSFAPLATTLPPSLPQASAPLFLMNDYAEREEDGRLRVTYAQIEQLLCMGIDGDYVRRVREIAFPGVTVGELMTLRTSGVSLELLEALHGAGYCGYTVDDVTALAFHGVTPSYVTGLIESGIKPDGLEAIAALKLQGVTAEFARGVGDYGFAQLSNEDVVNLRMFGVTGDYLQSLHNAGLTCLSTDDILLLRQYGISADYAKTVVTSGFCGIRAEDLIALHVAGVTGPFLGTLQAQNISGLSPSQVVRLRETGLTAELLRGAMDYGFDDLDISDLAELQNYGVTSEYLRELTSAGLPGMMVDDIVDLKSSGVPAAYVRAVLQYGFEQIDASEIVDLRNAGVTPPYLDAFANLGSTRLTPDEMMRLRAQGVSPDYAGGVYAFGFDDPSVDEIIMLSMAGVSRGYLDALGKTGLAFEPHEVIELVRNGVSTAFVEAWRDSGRSDIDVEEMIRLRAMGIRPGSSEDTDAIESPGE